MQYSSSYKGIIWTNHVLERLNERKIPQEWAWRAFQFADKRLDAKNESVKFRKKYENVTVTLIAKKNERKEWVIISCWVDPPLIGSADSKKRNEYWKERKKPFLTRLIQSLLSVFFPR